MAELSVEEISRLARNFLIGKGGPAEMEDLKRGMESDAQLPLELLQQMQMALDEVPPAGFSPDQWKEIDARVATLVAPLQRSRFGFLGRFFSRLFGGRSKPKAEAPTRTRRRQQAEEPAAQAAAAPLTVDDVIAPVAGDGLEDMAPIAAPSPAATASAPQASAAPEVEEDSAPKSQWEQSQLGIEKKKEGPKKWLWLLLALAILAALLWLSWDKGAAYLKSRQPVPTPQATALPTPTPRPSGPPRRGEPIMDLKEELPSQLPKQTPRAAGSYERPGDLSSHNDNGERGFPLP